MSGVSKYRSLQSSVPGLSALYGHIGEWLRKTCRSDSRVLIVGCGGGREIELLAQLDMVRGVTALDPCEQYLADAKSAAASSTFPAPIEFVRGTVADLPENDRYDVVTLLMVLHSINDDASESELLRALRSRLRASGRMVLADICFDTEAPLDAMIDDYRRHASKLSTADALVDLEIRAVAARLHRTATRLDTLLQAGGFDPGARIGVAGWYQAYDVAPRYHAIQGAKRDHAD